MDFYQADNDYNFDYDVDINSSIFMGWPTNMNLVSLGQRYDG